MAVHTIHLLAFVNVGLCLSSGNVCTKQLKIASEMDKTEVSAITSDVTMYVIAT